MFTIFLNIKKIIGVVLIANLAIIMTGCGKSAKDRGMEAVIEVPDTVYRPWDEVKDDEYYKLPEDKRFNVEYNDGVILIFGVNEDNKSVTIYGGNPNKVEKLEIPSDVEFSGKKYGVTNIAQHAFATFFNDSIKWMEGVKEIVVGERVETCGLGCFEGAPDVVRISLPSSLSSIGYCAMSDCEKLENVDFGVGSKLLRIDDFAFMNCTSLKKFEIPASVELIRQAPWRNCIALPYLSVIDGNSNYKSVDGVLYTISGRKLIQYPAGKRDREYCVESGTIVINNSAFYGNEHLEKVVFTSSLVEIDHLAFYGCTKLRDVNFNSGLKRIGNSAFEECKSMKKVRLPGNTEYTQGNEYGYDSFPEWTEVKN